MKSMYLIFILLAQPLLLHITACSSFADTVVNGQIRANNELLPFAIVGVKGTTYGTQADVHGKFIIESLPPGEYTFIASSMGFHSEELVGNVVADSVLTLNFSLKQSAIEIDGVAVTGTLMRSFVKESPTKISVVSPAYLEKIPTVNVMDVIQNVNGLYQQIDCGVCGIKQYSNKWGRRSLYCCADRRYANYEQFGFRMRTQWYKPIYDSTG